MLSFAKVGTLTVILVYLLILVGGIVRGVGAGMGCPDWPKCFDRWVPPLSESELPSNYKEVMLEKRKEKNQKLNAFANTLGLQLVADHQNDQVYTLTEFNTTKAWVEYVNRVIGVLIGFAILLTTVLSIRHIKLNRRVFIASALSLFLVLVQGYIGSVVVSTNLLPGLISFHMAVALLIVVILIYAVHFRNPYDKLRILKKNNVSSTLLMILLLATTTQVLMGTQVREVVDQHFLNGNVREEVNTVLDQTFVYLVHRSFSWVILIASVILFYGLKKKKKNALSTISLVILGMVLLEVIIGITLGYAGFPAIAQPIHLLVGTVIVGACFYGILKANTLRLTI